MLQHVLVVAQRVGVDQVFVGILHGEQLVGLACAGHVFFHDLHMGRSPPGDAVRVDVGDDAPPVDVGQRLLDMRQVVSVGHVEHVPVVCLQFHQLLFAHALVQVIIGLEQLEHTVFLMLHRGFILVDGEVESRHQLAVAPGLAFVKLVVEFSVAGHERDDEDDRCQIDNALVENVFV